MSEHSPSLPSIPSARLRPLRNRLRISIRDAGLTDLNPSAKATDRPFWTLEPTPLVIAPEEWSTLSNAIAQRARLTNAFLNDMYHHQHGLRDGIVPPELVLADPYYRHACRHLVPAEATPAPLIRFDLIRTVDGWCFTDTYTNTPVGLSYAIQNRRFLTQEAADYYRALPDYRSVINFPLEIVEALRGLSARAQRNPSIVFLTGGPRYPFYSEHSFLARKMGVRLAQGDDLLVLDNHVYFKTIAGLERVDVIYRRLMDSHIDPVVFSTDYETAGIPGLLQCIRSGNVVVANAIGVGIAENRALHACVPRMARYYLGEKPILPSIETHLCGDTDQLDAALDQRERLRIVPVHHDAIGRPRAPTISLKRKSLPRALIENPFNFVAQPHLTSVPLNPGARTPTRFRLSAFALSGNRNVSVFPGGIINLGVEAPPHDRVGVSADVIVLAGSADTTGALADFESPPEVEALSLAPSSRGAELLYWLGRYLERAESTARMLSILDDVELEEIPQRDRERWAPLWRGLLEATGQSHQRISPRANPTDALSGDRLWRMTLDASTQGSLLTSIGNASANAEQLREFVGPESGALLSQLHRELRKIARDCPRQSNKKSRAFRADAAAQAIALTLPSLNAFLGTARRTMLLDAGWAFLEIGMQLERAQFTTSTLSHGLIAPPASPGSEESDHSGGQHFRDNPELSALLRMLGSQDAYRRLYRMRSQPRFVAELLLQQSRAPRSILYNLERISKSLDEIEQTADDDAAATVGDFAVGIISQLKALRLDQHFSREARSVGQPLEAELDRLSEHFIAMHDLLSDHYFSHQARLDPGNLQSELELSTHGAH